MGADVAAIGCFAPDKLFSAWRQSAKCQFGHLCSDPESDPAPCTASLNDPIKNNQMVTAMPVGCFAPDQLFQLEDSPLNARLGICVVILNPIQHLAQHEVGICLNSIHCFL